MQESSSPTLPHVIAFLVELTRVLDCFPCSVYCPTVVWQTQGGKQMLAKWKWLPQWIFLPVNRFSPLIRILFLGPCREDATFLESGILIVNVKGIDTNGWFGNIMIDPKIILFIVILSGERLLVQLLLWPPFHPRKTHFYLSGERCSDATELGTNLSSLRCPMCAGTMVSTHPTSYHSPWKCDTCHYTWSCHQVMSLNVRMYRGLVTCPETAEDLLSFIRRLETVAHPHHYIVLQVDKSKNRYKKIYFP